MAQYVKALVAAVGAVVMTVTAAAADEAISFDEANGIWLAVVGALTALGVWAAPNRPPS